MRSPKRSLAALLSGVGLVTGVLALATPAYAATFTVGNTSNNGPGSLRQAIVDANSSPGADIINFAIPGAGVRTIALSSELPLITEAVTIDGRTQGSASTPLVELDGTNAGTAATGLWLSADGVTVRGLTINRFAYQQLLIDSANNTVADNFLGTDAAGTTGLAGGGFGTLRFRIGGSGNVIGGTVPSARNVIYGAVAIESGANNNTIQGNAIGVAADGTVLGGGGVRVTGATGNAILGNAIASTSGLGIDLGNDGVTANDAGDADGGANNRQNFPVINSVAVSGGSATVSGILQSEAGKNYRLDFFRNRSVGCDPSGNGDGEAFLDSINVTTDLNGNATISSSNLGGVNAVRSGDVITATATDPSGNTSEFSSCVTATAPTVPNEPTNVHAGAGDSTATVSWSAPASDGGSAITGYDVYSSGGGASVATVGAVATSASISGLTNGNNYSFVVKAHNGIGDSAASAVSESVTPTAGEPPATSKTQTVAAGATVSTGAAPTSTNPTVTAVKAPGGGTVSIAESSTTDSPPTGGTFIGQQVDITAPDATPANPLVLTFQYDVSAVDAAKPLRTYRTEGNGPELLVSDCLGSPDALGDGSPCVTSRTKNPTTGDWTVKVNTASASRWRTSQPEGGVIDDASTAVSYNGWSGVLDGTANGGSYRVSSKASSKVTFKTPVTTSTVWVTRTGPNGGQARVTVDGVTQGTIDLYSASPVANVQEAFSSSTSAAHTIVITVLATKNVNSSGTNVAVDAFLAGGTTTQESAAKVKYDSWTGASSSSASGGSYRYSVTKGAAVSVTFTGTSVSLTTAKGPGYGIVEVFIDNVSQGTVDLYAASQQWGFVQSYLAPSGSGTHAAKIVVTGTKNAASSANKVVFDAFGFS